MTTAIVLKKDWEDWNAHCISQLLENSYDKYKKSWLHERLRRLSHFRNVLKQLSYEQYKFYRGLCNYLLIHNATTVQEYFRDVKIAAAFAQLKWAIFHNKNNELTIAINDTDEDLHLVRILNDPSYKEYVKRTGYGPTYDRMKARDF